ncbi:MAG: ATP-binding cassette domain-containing protein [Bacteroidia bacterium]|nr:ATP-binding cassette domain-containing protein [Bacteroidia bacterium]
MGEVRVRLKKSLSGASGLLKLDVAFNLPAGSFTILGGPSGAGKTSILRMIAGLLKPENGEIYVGEQCWYDSKKGIYLKAQKRLQGFVFQDYALFPQMTIAQNLEFAASASQNRAKLQERISQILEMMDLTSLLNRKASSLSGGQQQRVALARAIIRKPPLLLLDEPFAALDPEMRKKMQEYLLKLHREFKLTTLMVSHDQGESINLADTIMMLSEGKIVNQGSPEEVFAHSNLSGKFRFTGEVLSIQASDVVFVVSILVGKNMVKVIVDKNEIDQLSPGDHVMLVSKAFNPIIKKIS